MEGKPDPGLRSRLREKSLALSHGPVRLRLNVVFHYILNTPPGDGWVVDGERGRWGDGGWDLERCERR